MMQKMTHRRAQTSPNVTWLRNGFAGQRDDTFGNRLAINNGALYRPCGTHVLHQHAYIGGTAAVRHFDTGKNLRQLFGATRRIFGRYHAQLQLAITAQSMLQRRNRFGFIIFDANQHALCLQYPGEDATSLQHFSRAVLHQTVIGSDVRFTLGGVDNQGFHPAQSTAQFSGGREACTT